MSHCQSLASYYVVITVMYVVVLIQQMMWILLLQHTIGRKMLSIATVNTKVNNNNSAFKVVNYNKVEKLQNAAVHTTNNCISACKSCWLVLCKKKSSIVELQSFLIAILQTKFDNCNSACKCCQLQYCIQRLLIATMHRIAANRCSSAKVANWNNPNKSQQRR